MKRIRGMKKRLAGVIIMLTLFQGGMSVVAGLSDNPYVSFSPDGDAYTMDAGVKDTEWYALGTVASTGVESRLAELKTGEHYYEHAVSGEVPVGYWKVMLTSGRCIHNEYMEEDSFHGVSFGKRKCYKSYFSGWMPYCADCGEQVSSVYHYMSENTAENTKCVDVSKAYYYKCPHCDNLEQAVEQYDHICKAVSANRYFVSYHANGGNGYMGKSAHMYNNAQEYNGREVTPQTSLSLNVFTRTGYVFTGWSTEPDGSGTFYGDGEEIWNLSEEEGGVVSLYAQWEICESGLCIDPNGGIYLGSDKTMIISGVYGEIYKPETDKLLPPKGNIVHFETGQGEAVADMISEKKFQEWVMDYPFYGKFNGIQYTFANQDGIMDCLTAVYRDEEIILPEAFREGYSFGGWYRDKECTQLVGNAGSKLVPTKEITLYAGWVELQLQSEDNYLANRGRGAVNLSWRQKEQGGEVYLVFQRREDTEWKQIESKTVAESTCEVDITLEYSDWSRCLIVPYSGFYRMTMYGAQGGNYGIYFGGKGGMTEAGIYLEKGEKLFCEVGGQNGVPGGGSGSLYGNGGGYSMVTSDKKGVLMIAGGGGGASELENGLPGGLQNGLTETQNGENGICGGGGGYYGGRAGEVLVHHHNENCRHVHTGTPTTPGGCYFIPVYCDGTTFQKKEKSRVFYYGNIDDYGNHIFCVRCGSDYCPGHLDIKYCYECQVCKTSYDCEMKRCVTLTEYALGCGREEAYVCGYEEGELLSSRAAYGGMSYVNKDYCCDYVLQPGIKEGNGRLQLVSQYVGAVSENYLNGVVATDLASPDKIDESTIKRVAMGENKIRISFQKPADKGTKYYHQVKSLDVKTNQVICVSNETVNILTTEVIGYMYVLDYFTETEVDMNASYYAGKEENPSFEVDVESQVQYLHIAPIDKAGNLGETTHIKISNQDVVYWPVMTQQLEIREDVNVIQTENGEFYVRADSMTPFEIEMDAYICGTAGKDYQIDEMNIISYDANTTNESVYTVITPRKDEISPGLYVYPMQQLQKKVWGEANIQDAGYTVSKRFNYCRNVKLIQQFVIDREFHGRRINLMPQALIHTAKESICSDRENDVKNRICLIADGKGPEISGLEVLEDREGLDFSEGEIMDICVWANDADSGLATFYVEIVNMENGSVVRYEDKALTGSIHFSISSENIVFNGKFSIMAYARDRVGNESVVGKDLLGIGLYAYVERLLEPHTGVFKRGETGVLHIQTIGYVERVEVFLQQDLLQEGVSNPVVYIYEIPEYIQTEQWEFVIPLTASDGEKTIKVIAYKEGTELSKSPQFVTILVEGSILDELRTRLR